MIHDMASTGKKKDLKPLTGQKSISSFFSAKPTQAKRSQPAQEGAQVKRQKQDVGLTTERHEVTLRDNRGQENAIEPQSKDQQPNIKIPDECAAKTSDSKGGEQFSAELNRLDGMSESQKASLQPSNCISGEESAREGPQENLPRENRAEEHEKGHPNDRPRLLGQSLVGQHILVLWKEEKKWFPGKVTGFNAVGKHFICYDDGDKEWVDLQQEQWKVSPNKDSDEDESDFDVGQESSDDADEPTLLDSDASGDENVSPNTAARARPQKVPRKSVSTAKPVGTKAVKPKAASRASLGSAKTPSIRRLASGLQGSTTPASISRNDEGKPDAFGLPDCQRFSAREAERFPFLHPDRMRDASRKRPTDAEYNPRTLWIPPDWFKSAKVSEGQRQWWEFKSKNFDSVLLFKMGKFYEMFEMDAHTGVEILGLAYMKGEQPHCGFPEANYHLHAERLARAGLRVVCIEQTETPDMLKERNEQRRASGLPKAGVVSRKVVAVLTKGTMVDPEMVCSHQDSSYVLALTERSQQGKGLEIGVCAFDCATAEIMLGSWIDDDMRTVLKSQLSSLRPVELVIPSQGLSGFTSKILQTSDLLETDGAQEGGIALSAFGGAVSFLRSVLLDRAVVGLGKISLLRAARNAGDCRQSASSSSSPDCVLMDGSALENLEILETASGDTEGTVLSTLDACATSGGRRRLKDWLCRPLGQVSAIQRRQDAVRALKETVADAALSARRSFREHKDVERAIAGICASSIGSFGRSSASVVLYEDAAKRKVNAFVTVLKGLKAIQEAFSGFQALQSQLRSEALIELTTPGSQLPDFEAALEHLMQATDWESASLEGRIIPQEGVNEDFDAAQAGISEVDAHLAKYLKEVQQEVGSKQVGYVSLQKDSHVLEIPEEKAKKLPSHYQLMAQRKGFRRYMTEELRDLLRQRAKSLEEKEAALAGILQALVNKFAEDQAIWNKLMWCVAELDALMSLALAAEQASAWGPICQPEFVEVTDGQAQVFEALQLRHPAAFQGDFVPNDLRLGNPNFLVITGPNMGGKSTLIRQACIATVLAHVGAFVPAQSFRLSPVDAIFVRMGARDSIISGQSTFFVELQETAAALHRATARSLVGLDELGRGTQTSDGSAIAAAVLQHFASVVQCRGLFATHYHKLAEDVAQEPTVGICHMACQITTHASGHDEVTFLYKIAQGSCPRSYGTNVARLAGIPDTIVERAAQHAAELESTAEKNQKRVSSVTRHDEVSFRKFHGIMKEISNFANSAGKVEELRVLQEQAKALLE